jgi:hypothetical protein
MEEENNQEWDESTPKKRSKAAGIGIGLAIGIAFFGLSALMPFSGAWLVIFLLYIGLIILCYVKGEENIGLGLILTLCIPLLIFGGCLVLIATQL